MSQAFTNWIQQKEKERYFVYEIAEMAGLSWSTFRLHREPGKVKMSKKTALKIHEATGISMEDLGFVELLRDQGRS